MNLYAETKADAGAVQAEHKSSISAICDGGPHASLSDQSGTRRLVLLSPPQPSGMTRQPFAVGQASRSG
jgi:hypothetical protein